MNSKLCFILLLFIGYAAQAQLSPVQWSFSAVKKSATEYEIHLKAITSAPWHIYSMASPERAGLPTKFTFKKNPLVAIMGKTKETGKIKSKYEDVFETTVKYFDGPAEFVQLIKLRSPVKTTLSGSVEFMACKEGQCLPPQTVPFTVQLQ